MSPRTCHECGVTIYRGESAIRVGSLVFCSEECADDTESDSPTNEDLAEMYPDWSM